MITRNINDDNTLSYLFNGNSKAIKKTEQKVSELEGKIGDVIFVGPDEPEDPKIKLWLDTDEQGASAVTSVNGKNGTVVLNADDVGAMSKWDLLWANASPTSAFAAQTVSLDLSGYSAVAIFFKRSTDAGYDQGLLTFIALIGQTYIDQMMTASSSNVAFLMRQFSTSNSGITFAAAKLSVQGSASSEADRTQYLIPLYIYGIKGVA